MSNTMATFDAMMKEVWANVFAGVDRANGDYEGFAAWLPYKSDTTGKFIVPVVEKEPTPEEIDALTRIS